MRTSFAVSAAFLSLSAACAPSAVDLDAARASLHDAVEAYHAAAAATDAEAIVGLYSAQGAMMPPDEPDVVGLTAIRSQVEGFTSLEDFQFRAEPATIVLSADGQMGYSVAAVNLSWTDGGETARQRLRDVHLWTRDPDGAWKVAIDVWNGLPTQDE